MQGDDIDEHYFDGRDAFLADIAAFLEPLDASLVLSDTESATAPAITTFTTTAIAPRSPTDAQLRTNDLEQPPQCPQPRSKPTTARNVTRERRRRELQELRLQCAALETQLATLRSTAHCASAVATTQHLLLRAWRSVAQQQLAQRKRAEHTNVELRQTLAQHEAMAKHIHLSLQQWLAIVPPTTITRAPATAKPTRVAMQPFATIDASDVAIYRQLLADLDCEHARMDHVLAASGLIHWQTAKRASTAQVKTRTDGPIENDGHFDTTAYLELLEVDTLPFAPATVCRASWRCWQRRQLPSQTTAMLTNDTTTTLVAKLGYDLVVDGATVALELLCVIRAYIESDGRRASTVLRGVTKSDAHFPGVFIDETDWQLMVPIESESDGATTATAIYSCAHMAAKRSIDSSGGGSASLSLTSPFARLTATTYEVDMDELCNRMTSMLLLARRSGDQDHHSHANSSFSRLPSAMAAAAYVRDL